MRFEALDHNAREIAEENSVDISESMIGRALDIGEHLLRTNLALGETQLPAEYIDYRNRVRRWRAQLAYAGEEIEIERKARERANRILSDTNLMEQQLRQTEAEHGWNRSDVP